MLKEKKLSGLKSFLVHLFIYSTDICRVPSTGKVSGKYDIRSLSEKGLTNTSDMKCACTVGPQ